MSVYWVGDFETGNRAQYSTMFGATAAVNRTSFPQSSPAPLQGKYCCRIELRPGEHHSDGTSRLQLRGTAGSGVPSAYFARGSHLWFRYAVMIGAETSIYQSISNPWRAITAWPSVDDGAFSPSKMFCQRISGVDQIYFGGDSGVSGANDHLQGTAVSNPKAMQWYEFVSEWLFHETNGIIAHYVRKPGETSFTPIPLDAKAKLTNRTLTSSTDRSNLRYGTYRNDAFTSTDVFYLDRMTAYTTEAEAFADTPINVGGGTDPLPPAPTGIKAVAGFTSTGAHKVAVSCDPVPGLIAGDGYYVSRNETRISGNTPLPSPAYTDADPALAAGVEYRYRMYAGLAPNRLGPWTEPPATVTLTAQTDTTPPAAPGVVVATSVTATSVAMSWAASSSPDVVSYRLERNVNGGAWAVLQAALDVTTYTDTGLTGGTTYGYRVSAIDAAGNVSQATQETLVTPAATPGTPTGVTVSAPSARRLTVSWGAVAGASAYNVWRNSVLVASGIAGTTFGDDVEPGDYVYQVTAGTAPNVSAKSAGVAGTAYGIIGLPEFIDLPSRAAGSTAPVTAPMSLTGRGLFTATPGVPWLSAAPASGTLSDTPIAVTVTANPTGLPAGAQTGAIAFAELPAASPPPVNTAPPGISGTAAAGSTLTGSDGSWSASPTSFTRTWYRR